MAPLLREPPEGEVRSCSARGGECQGRAAGEEAGSALLVTQLGRAQVVSMGAEPGECSRGGSSSAGVGWGAQQVCAPAVKGGQTQSETTVEGSGW